MIRVAIVGAGVMGASHARVLAAVRGAELVAVLDPDAAKGHLLAAALDVPMHRIEDLPEVADAAIIATPSHTHADLGIGLLDAGLDLLVEKPIATTLEDADRLVAAAERTGRVVLVGHVERFNPAVVGLQGIVTEPLHLEFTRIGPFTPRVTSDVVLDLMIHDLDLARMLAGPISDVAAVGRAVHTSQPDLACALLTAESGVTVSLTASRSGQKKVRLIEITQRDSFVVADLLRQDINVHRVAHGEYLSEGGARYRQSGMVEIPFLERTGEPLRAELEHFVDAVRRQVRPAVDPREAREALQLALHVRALIEKAG